MMMMNKLFSLLALIFAANNGIAVAELTQGGEGQAGGARGGVPASDKEAQAHRLLPVNQNGGVPNNSWRYRMRMMRFMRMRMMRMMNQPAPTMAPAAYPARRMLAAVNKGEMTSSSTSTTTEERDLQQGWRYRMRMMRFMRMRMMRMTRAPSAVYTRGRQLMEVSSNTASTDNTVTNKGEASSSTEERDLQGWRYRMRMMRMRMMRMRMTRAPGTIYRRNLAEDKTASTTTTTTTDVKKGAAVAQDGERDLQGWRYRMRMMRMRMMRMRMTRAPGTFYRGRMLSAVNEDTTGMTMDATASTQSEDDRELQGWRYRMRMMRMRMMRMMRVTRAPGSYRRKLSSTENSAHAASASSVSAGATSSATTTALKGEEWGSTKSESSDTEERDLQQGWRYRMRQMRFMRMRMMRMMNIPATMAPGTYRRKLSAGIKGKSPVLSQIKKQKTMAASTTAAMLGKDKELRQ